MSNLGNFQSAASSTEAVQASAGSTAAAAKFFDGFAPAFDSLYDKKRGRFMRWVDENYRSDMFVRFQLSFERLGNLRGKTLADIGCGSGPYVIEALKRGAAHVVAVDPAPGMLKLLRERLVNAGREQNCTIIKGSLPEIAIPQCDHAIVMGVLDYVEDPRPFLRALRSGIRTSAVLSFPSKHWFRTPFRKFRYWVRSCPVYFYDRNGIELLCRESGFSDVQVHKIPGAGMDYHVWLSA
ncbi:MAG TPA: class I SAM-dependent methyltransferase [Candidatus Acidoferrum sp.]|nr:class I SAM-dependent methyltransferase [Candidatus Acidoferrum sp.]